MIPAANTCPFCHPLLPEGQSIFFALCCKLIKRVMPEMSMEDQHMMIYLDKMNFNDISKSKSFCKNRLRHLLTFGFFSNDTHHKYTYFLDVLFRFPFIIRFSDNFSSSLRNGTRIPYFWFNSLHFTSRDASQLLPL